MDLKDAILRTARFAGIKTGNTLHEFIHFIPDPQRPRGYVYATNGLRSVAIEVSGIDLPYISIDAKRLADAVRPVKTVADIQLRGGIARITSAGDNQNIKHRLPATSFPELALPVLSGVGWEKWTESYQVSRQLLSAVGKLQAEPITQQVQIKEGFAAASDRSRLSYVECDFDPAIDCTTHYSLFQHILKKDTVEYQVVNNNFFIRVNGSEFRWSVPLPDKGLKFSGYVPELSDYHCITLPVKQVKEAAKALKAASTVELLQLDVSYDNTKIKAYETKDLPDLQGSVEFESKGPPASIVIRSAYLVDVATVVYTPTMELYYRYNNDPIVIKSEKLTYCIWPVLTGCTNGQTDRNTSN